MAKKYKLYPIKTIKDCIAFNNAEYGFQIYGSSSDAYVNNYDIENNILNELETQRSSTEISKHGFLLKDIAKLSLAVAGQNYKAKSAE